MDRPAFIAALCLAAAGTRSLAAPSPSAEASGTSADGRTDEPLGLVLSGGGAKGAYEVGVWQELRAAGIGFAEDIARQADKTLPESTILAYWLDRMALGTA